MWTVWMTPAGSAQAHRIYWGDETEVRKWWAENRAILMRRDGVMSMHDDSGSVVEWYGVSGGKRELVKVK